MSKKRLSHKSYYFDAVCAIVILISAVIFRDKLSHTNAFWLFVFFMYWLVFVLSFVLSCREIIVEADMISFIYTLWPRRNRRFVIDNIYDVKLTLSVQNVWSRLFSFGVNTFQLKHQGELHVIRFSRGKVNLSKLLEFLKANRVDVSLGDD
jgi:hypothetical protein